MRDLLVMISRQRHACIRRYKSLVEFSQSAAPHKDATVNDIPSPYHRCIRARTVYDMPGDGGWPDIY
ncbi:hypothetical protein PISMIDRAFT_685939 [Pisolithus microcarpus 441]|uniref:Uncharacterized protein n=1 Tax=Pisolithus microcarpus 441 TaxID=765257 RepID=A0A0C9ZA81_9AGAM|nr:hypothetical protein PISMIDRAFT_685939 [Pisolithus microcarpus 441]